jgi:hypothetical protein
MLHILIGTIWALCFSSRLSSRTNYECFVAELVWLGRTIFTPGFGLISRAMKLARSILFTKRTGMHLANL